MFLVSIIIGKVHYVITEDGDLLPVGGFKNSKIIEPRTF
jgi:hypothetical protein